MEQEIQIRISRFFVGLLGPFWMRAQEAPWDTEEKAEQHLNAQHVDIGEALLNRRTGKKSLQCCAYGVN